MSDNSEQIVLLTEYDPQELPTLAQKLPNRQKVTRGRSGNSKISQDKLIPHIVKVLHKHGGRATKSQVEEEIYQLLKDTFNDKWFQEKVSHGVPRWKHFIAYAKERAKLLHGYVKGARESGRGVWELTSAGEKYYHTLK